MSIYTTLESLFNSIEDFNPILPNLAERMDVFISLQTSTMAEGQICSEIDIDGRNGFKARTPKIRSVHG